MNGLNRYDAFLSARFGPLPATKKPSIVGSLAPPLPMKLLADGMGGDGTRTVRRGGGSRGGEQPAQESCGGGSAEAHHRKRACRPTRS